MIQQIQYRKCLRIFLITSFTAVVTIFAFSAQAQLVGFENEYAMVGFTGDRWGQRQQQTGKELLEIVRAEFGGFGAVRLKPWSRNSALHHPTYVDSQGREWNVYPEPVNANAYDGIEFVPPPQSTDEDIDRIERILKKIKETRKVMRGFRSSSHVTVSVAHLMQDRRNISALVDLILTIENHWVEIYRLFRPVRYGTTVNRFAIPLAVDQQELLKDLAEIPPSERSYERIRSVFLQYAENEKFLHGDGPWKYRAANYAKLFALRPGETPIEAIEFRLGDLDFGNRMTRKIAFLRRLVNATLLDTEFRAPFGETPIDAAKASEILEKATLDTTFTTRFFQNGETSKESASRSVPKPTIDLADISSPIKTEGGFLTFGFEAEFRGDNERVVLESDSRPRLDQFPYLDHVVGIEETGNKEVRSLGGERILAETLEQMAEIKTALDGDLKGYHLRIRVPPQTARVIPRDKLQIWLALVSDAIFAWRAQNRKSFFAFNTISLARQSPSKIFERGPLRAIWLPDGALDIEIRGYMGSLSDITTTAQKIITGILNPQLIQVSRFMAKRLWNQHRDLQTSLELFTRTHHGRSLSEKEKTLIDAIDITIEGKGILPLYDFTALPGLKAVDRRKIRDANFIFLRDTFDIIQKRLAGHIDSDKNAEIQFREQLKTWAISVDLQRLIEERILSSTPAREIKTGKGWVEETSSWMRQLEVGDPNLATELSKNNHPEIWKVLRLAMMSPLIGSRETALMALEGRTGAEAVRILEIGMRDADVSNRLLSADMLGAMTDRGSLTVLMTGAADSELDVRLQVIRNIEARGDRWALDTLQKLTNDQSEEVREAAKEAIEVLQALPEPQPVKQASSSQAIDKVHSNVLIAMLKSEDASIRRPAVRELARRFDWNFEDKVYDMINSKNPYEKRSAYLILLESHEYRSLPLSVLGTIDKVFTSERDQLEILDVLKRQAHPRVFLSIYAHSPHESVKKEIINIASKLKLTETAEAFSTLIKDKSPEIREMTTEALISTKSPDAYRILEQNYDGLPDAAKSEVKRLQLKLNGSLRESNRCRIDLFTPN